MQHRLWVVAVAAATAGQAMAGELPLYEAAPAWVEVVPLPTLASFDGAPPMLLSYDVQQRVEGDRLWTYVDTASHAGAAEMLNQLSSVILSWAPDKGDLRIHELTIRRGDQTIDALAGDKRLEILRREQNLEALEVSGILTATMAIQDVRVGDIVRLRYSITMKDAALGGHVQGITSLPAAPLRMGPGRFRLAWDKRSKLQWKLHADKPEQVQERSMGDLKLVDIALPMAKQPDMPADAPTRYRHPPLIEMSSFASWAEVSKIFAPLYASKGLIEGDAPLRAELAKLRALPGTQRQRAAAALRLVQDDIRYLAIGMDGGNYVPQSPSRTWSLRYGDCKAKTLLLLSLLHGLGIEAEAVMAHASAGDAVNQRLPSASAFNHVLVRATIDGETLWLDGTGSGTRLADLGNTPLLGLVLPIRAEGADPIPVVTHADAQPSFELSVTADESGSVKLPSPFEAVGVMRGPTSAAFNLRIAQMDKAQRDDLVRSIFTNGLGEGQFSDLSIETDADAATITMKARGIRTSPWYWSANRFRRQVGDIVGGLTFEPDRSRAAWLDIPVQTPAPVGTRYHLRLRLPEGGKGYVLEGDAAMRQTIAGRDLRRETTLRDGLLEIDERIDATGVEIAAAQIPDERDRLATAQAVSPVLVAPVKPRHIWEVSREQLARWPQVKLSEEIFASAIAQEPDEASKVDGYSSRARFRRWTGDLPGALSDLDKAIAIAGAEPLYLQRAAVRLGLKDLDGATADARLARQLNPSSFAAISTLAEYLARAGKLDEGLALIEPRIAIGGDTRDNYRTLKASLLGTYGDPAKAVALLDAHIVEKPGMATLMNLRCWVKASRAVMLDSARQDCTRAVEISEASGSALDSRAMLWFRLEHYEQALQDLDAALLQEPDAAASHFLRGIILHRLGRKGEGDAELAAAERIRPLIDQEYARFGIRP